ncbi:MAG TPA: glycosyltransferase family 1 protein [Candidatus Binataceae bacterium]|nr:glycosyltransferase family 1 protein [Candidatus Binataceae bacterium]
MDENRLREDRSELAVRRALIGFSSTDEGRPPMHPTLEPSSRSAASSPQHICVVTETYPPEINGVALTLAQLVKGLLARGHTVSVVHPEQRNRPTSHGSESGFYSEAILVRGLPLPGYHGLQFGMPAKRLLRRSWRQHPPAAIYVATEGPLGWSAMRAARSLGIPTVSGFHTNFHHYCKHYGVGWLQDLALRYLRWFHNQTECTLVANEDLRARLQRARFNNVSVLERGVDSQLFAPERRCTGLRREWGLAYNDLVLIYVGRIAAEKNLEVAIEAYRAMRVFNDRIKFVIVGDGPLRRALQRDHAELIFAGMQSGAQLARHYASADVFLFPSETETFGNVTLEAMASGLVVIAYNYAGAKLHITHGETGVLVRFGDVKAFVDSACSLIREPQAVKTIRRQAREYATSLNWPRVVEQFETLLMSAGARASKASRSPLTRRSLAT